MLEGLLILIVRHRLTISSTGFSDAMECGGVAYCCRNSVQLGAGESVRDGGRKACANVEMSTVRSCNAGWVITRSNCKSGDPYKVIIKSLGSIY